MLQAGEWLQNQMGEQSASAQALVDAKNELLTLQKIVRQKDVDISSLHDAMRQCDSEVEQLVTRLDAATRDYTAAHEESRQLHDTVRQFEETLVAERAEHSAMLNELRGESAIIERESARLALERLHKENEELRRREAESAEVVGRLMADIEAGHRLAVHPVKPATTMVTYTQEEHDSDVERQLLALRAELEEMFGEDIGRMKEQMRDHYSTTVDQLRRDLARSEEECSRYASQTNLWQQQYMVLSQQGVSSVDIAQRLNDAIVDNVQQRQHVAELTARVQQLNSQLSVHPHSSSQTQASETSHVVEEYKREVAEKSGTELRSLRTQVDELQSKLIGACEDRDRSIARCQTVEHELEALKQELLSARSRHSDELQQVEVKAASDIAELSSQLISTKEQLETVQFTSISASSARDEMECALTEKQSQFETVKKDCESRIKQLKTDNAEALECLSNEYKKQLEMDRVKMITVIEEYKSRDHKSLALIEELQMKYEILKKENRAANEQTQHQSGQVLLNADVLTTPSAAVWGASDVDSVVAQLSSQLEKVTRERDSAMQSLQTVYGDRIELQQTIKMLESERTALTNRVSHLDAERHSLNEDLTQARGELSRLKHSVINRSAASLSSVGTGSIPNMPSVTGEAERQGPDVIDSLRAEFEELQRLRREKDRSSSASAVMTTDASVSVLQSHSDVDVKVNVASLAAADNTQSDTAAGQSPSAEVDETLSAEEIATMKQEYTSLCAELVRLREMLITLQRVDHEREQVRSQFELEIRLLRDEMLNRNRVDTAAVTETIEAALGDELKERDAEIDSLKGHLTMMLSRMEELIAEKDQQCTSYEHELEEVREEHSNALKRINALVQEHNILLGGQVPLSSVAPENVREMPAVIHSEILEGVDEDLSPKRMAYENQATEIECLREQLHRAAQDIEALSLARDKLNEALESNTVELLASLEKAASENTEQRQMYEKKLATYSRESEQLNQKLDITSAELEQSRSAHSSEMEKLREDYQAQFNELSFSSDEAKREQHQELCAVQKQCAELQAQMEQIAAEKASVEQEYITALQDITKEHSARISALREGFVQDLAQVQVESGKAYDDHAVQLEEELNQSRQEIAELKQSLKHKHEYETGDLEAVQVLQLRINDLTEMKVELVKRLDAVTAENERLISEADMLQSEKENLRSQVAPLLQDYPQCYGGLDVESFADTSGDSHVFCTPAKSKKTAVEKMKSLQAEKELLTNMVERLNAEKEQLKCHLIAGPQPSHVFEADICHLELSSPELVEVSQAENGAEVRMIALESEKEILAGILEKLSYENEQLSALKTTDNDNILDSSYDDILVNVEKSYDEPELSADEAVALRYGHAVLMAKFSDMEQQVTSVSVQPTEGQESIGTTRDVEMVDSSIQTDIHHVDRSLSAAAHQTLVDSSVQVDLRTVHTLGSLQVSSVELTMKGPADEGIVGDSANTKASDGTDKSGEDLSLRATESETRHASVDDVRMLEESLSITIAERDKFSADLSHVLRELVELKASKADLTETTKHSIEALKSELDSAKSECETLSEQEAATERQLASMKVERDELSCKIGALQDALKLAVEERDQCIQSRSGAEAQSPGSTGLVLAISDESNLAKNSVWLQTHVKELEDARTNLLDEKEAVAELYGRTVDELKSRLADMQATVESLQAELSAKTQENDAVVGDLTSQLQAAETECFRVDAENRQKLLDLATVQFASEEKQRIIDELTCTLDAVSVSKSDSGDEHNANVSVVGRVNFLQSEVSRLRLECDQLSSRLVATEQKEIEALSQPEDDTLANEETGTDVIDSGLSQLQQVNKRLSVEVQCATPQTAEQSTITEEPTFSGINGGQVDDVNVETDSAARTACLDEDVSALQMKLQMLKTELDAVTAQRDSFAAKLAELEHSSEKPKHADLALVDTGLTIAENKDFAEQTDGLLGSEEATDGQMPSQNTDHKERYVRLQHRHRIDMRNTTAKSLAVETVDAAVETDVPAEQNVSDNLQARIDELFNETCSLKDERDEIRQKLLVAETCTQEIRDSTANRIKVLEDELIPLREELHRFETRCKTFESEQQETAQTWIEKNQKFEGELHAVSAQRDSLSDELDLAKCDLDACRIDYDKKTFSAENRIEDLRIELAASLQSQQVLTDELSTCKLRLEAAAGSESKLAMLTEKCSELETMLSTIKQDRDAMKEKSINSHAKFDEFKQVHQQNVASMQSKIDDLELQLAALKDENTTLTTGLSVALDKYNDFKNSQTKIETKLRNQIDDLAGQVGSLSMDLEKAGLNCSAAEGKCEELQHELEHSVTDAANKLETLSSELKNSTEERLELIGKLADMDNTCATLKSQLLSATEDRNSMMAQLHMAESEQVELKKGYQEALANNECLEKECQRLSQENKCLTERCGASESARSTAECQLGDQQQKTSFLQTENNELRQTKESLLSEIGGLKQQISEYIDRANMLASNEQLAHENWTREEQQLLSMIKGFETDLSTLELENGTLKSEVERIPLLTTEVASITVERDGAYRRCGELEAENVKLRESVEDLMNKFEASNCELMETKTDLLERCEEAEHEVDRLKKLVEEKNICVVDLKSALEITQEELAESRRERESLSAAVALVRDAAKEQTAAHETAMSKVMSHLHAAEATSSKLEQLEKEFASKCEELRVAEDQLYRQQQQAESVDGDVEALRQECDNLRTLMGTCRLDANTACEKLGQMEGVYHTLAAERDTLVKEKCTLHAEKGEMSRKLVLLQQQLEQINADTNNIAVEQQVLVEQLGAVCDESLVQEDAAGEHENQTVKMNAKIFDLESELNTARETIHLLRKELTSLQQENVNLQQIRLHIAEDNLKTASPELVASQPDTARRLQQELAGERSSRSTEGWEELQTRLDELDALTAVETDMSSAADSATSGSAVRASRTFTKLVPSDGVAPGTSTCLSDDKLFPVEIEVKSSPGGLVESSAGSSSVHASRTFTKLVLTDDAACQTDLEIITGNRELVVNDLHSQIDCLQFELEQPKLSQMQLTEKLQADFAKVHEVLLRENEQLKEENARVKRSSTEDEIKQHYQSKIEVLESEFQEQLAALKDECDRQVTASENSARTSIVECSASETSVVESTSSSHGSSTSQISELRLHLAEKTRDMTELRNLVEWLREENKNLKMSSSRAAAAVAENIEPCTGYVLDLDEESRKIVANLESQLLMSTEENDRLQRKIIQLEQQVEAMNVVRQQIEEQHLTEMKVLEFRLQESYEQQLSLVRAEVEADLEETYRKRKEALDAEFRKRSENFRKETEHKFLQEFKKVCF